MTASRIIDFKNAVQLIAEPEVSRNILLPVYEAIHNSIHSLKQSNNENGNITVEFKRDNNDIDPKKILEIIIKDDGSGFTPVNIESFGKIFSTHKKEEFNCKGIGRLSYFVPFLTVSIDSTFTHNNKNWKIIEDINENNFHTISEITPKQTEDKYINTKICLKNINPKWSDKFKIEESYIKNSLKDHFLPSTLSMQNITIKIIDSEGYYIKSNINDVIKDTPILLKNNSFEIFHLKNRSTHRSTHKIIFSADGRSVKNFPINFLPNAKIGNGDDKYYLNTVVVSDYLNKTHNIHRNGFNTNTTSLFEDSISEGEIYEKCLDKSRSFSQESILRFECVLDKHIDQAIDELPHLSFLKNDTKMRNEMKLGDDITTVKSTLVKRFAEKQVESFNFVKSFTKQYEDSDIPNYEDFKKNALSKLEEGMRINHAPLVSYIKYRDFVLTIYDKLLSKKGNGKYQPEKILHDIIFPTKYNSSNAESDYFKHNLWIIDDRYAIYDFLTSDLPEHITLGTKHDPKDKRYDICAAYSDPIGEEHNVFIIELKKTNLALAADNDPIEQISNYVLRMINRKLKKHDGKRINITDHTQFYGIVICDINNDYFIDYMVARHSLKKRPDSKSYHTVLLNERFFLEVTNYENLLDIAHSRNKVFIDKLNYK